MQPGNRLGEYDLVEELGAGGMGVVWRAHDRRLGRDVALKILPPQFAVHPEARLRFEREARGLAALSHPNIISIFDLGEEDGLHYIVTELLSGETLRVRIQRGPLPWRKAAELCATIADGLAAAHAKGIIHRDLKPENVFITADERVKILDFGLVKEMALAHTDAITQTHHTEPGIVLGTLGYMSPEQLRGEPIDFASDIFSLGCVLYEMIAGRPAFMRNSSVDTIAAILTAEPEAVGMLSDLPPDLSRTIERCLEKQPRARFQSGSDLAFALRALSASQPAFSRPAVPDARAGRSIRAAIAISAAVLLLAVGLLMTRQRRQANPPVAEVMTLAVLSFTAEAEQAYAGEGLADSLFRRLARLKPLQVVSRRTTPGQPLSAAAAGAAHVLRGSIAQNQNEVTVDAELVKVPSGHRLWNRRYSGSASDLLGIETRLSSDVEQFIRGYAHLATAVQSDKSATTIDPEAFREYMKGRYYWNKFTSDGFQKALDHFGRSIDLDPTYALAYAGLADTYTLLGVYGHAPAEMLPKARAAARRAIELDPQLGEASTALGTALYLLDWKWSEAEEALRRGVELNPRYATAHHSYALYLSLVGRSDEALREIRTASELDPLSLPIYMDVAWIHYTRNETALAIANIERAIRHDPASPHARYELANYLDQLGRYEEAVDAFEAGLRLEKQDTSPARLLRGAYESEGAKGYLRQKLALAASAESPHTARGEALMRLGEEDAAMDEFEAAYETRERDVIYFKSSQTYERARRHPRFQGLLAKIGFPN